MGLYGTDFYALRSPVVTEDITPAAMTATRTYHGPWAQRFDFARAVLGREEILPGPPVQITYEAPVTYPGRDDLYAQRVVLRGDGASFESPDHPDEIAYDWCLAEVHFEQLSWEVTGDEYISIELDGTSEYLTIEGGIEYASGQVVPGVTPILVPQIDFAIEFFKLAEIPWHWFSLVGKVNEDPWRGIPAGHLLFLPSSVRAQRNTAGHLRYQARASFSYRRVPWNYGWNPYTGQFELQKVIATGDTVYETARFQEIASG